MITIIKTGNKCNVLEETPSRYNPLKTLTWNIEFNSLKDAFNYIDKYFVNPEVEIIDEED